jgi:uncharacterized protein YndB with AHSA1/START domain
MSVGFTAGLKIREAAAKVFAAVADPARLGGYFVERASAPLMAGAKVMWTFHWLEGAFPVRVLEVEADARIVIAWRPAEGHETRQVCRR